MLAHRTTNLRTKVFNFALKREQQRALRHMFFFTCWCKLMLEVKSKRHGGAGYASITVVSALQSTIGYDQVLEVNSAGDVRLNIVCESAEAVMDKEFFNSLKSQESRFNAKTERI